MDHNLCNMLFSYFVAGYDRKIIGTFPGGLGPGTQSKNRIGVNSFLDINIIVFICLIIYFNNFFCF